MLRGNRPVGISDHVLEKCDQCHLASVGHFCMRHFDVGLPAIVSFRHVIDIFNDETGLYQGTAVSFAVGESHRQQPHFEALFREEAEYPIGQILFEDKHIVCMSFSAGSDDLKLPLECGRCVGMRLKVEHDRRHLTILPAVFPPCAQFDVLPYDRAIRQHKTNGGGLQFAFVGFAHKSAHIRFHIQLQRFIATEEPVVLFSLRLRLFPIAVFFLLSGQGRGGIGFGVLSADGFRIDEQRRRHQYTAEYGYACSLQYHDPKLPLPSSPANDRLHDGRHAFPK